MAGTKKRAREDAEEPITEDVDAPKPADHQIPSAEPAQPNNDHADNGIDNEDDAPLVSNYKMNRTVCSGHECPYLDSISRQVRFNSLQIHCFLEKNKLFSSATVFVYYFRIF